MKWKGRGLKYVFLLYNPRSKHIGGIAREASTMWVLQVPKEFGGGGGLGGAPSPLKEGLGVGAP